ncbi:RNA polymerase sigma-54 factor [Lactobacillus selangorensis]|uniref:RNA polymerase sigma-54 factor n=1 Tax=Lactobacillus selangorensis TaxID=81857 RepID=A0A0R2FJR5_9LACO|nr:RNA polymerase factor sigma-54 [Lactobacillus selangorensis]KRN28800.1 RNA polymerase sigma-54 factor [Lactobacillus selangorensis]KRN32790.1 RNA polymerase sigma-54 factor [Lactobacillus selangorensis]
MTQVPKMTQTPRQRLVTRLFLSPQVNQELTILQFNASQLAAYLQTAALANPLIQLTAPQHSAAATAFDWGTTGDSETLSEHLLAQKRLLTVAPLQKLAVTALIMDLNDAGYLQHSLAAISTETQLPSAALTTALPLLQHFEPLGVGAHDLNECLLLQAQAQPNFDRTALTILRQQQLEKLADPQQWQQLPAAESALRAALAAIRTLNPTPGSQFSHDSENHYLTPDLYLTATESGPALRIASDLLPMPVFNDAYFQQLTAIADSETKRYLREQTTVFQQLETAMLRRKQTLLLIGEYIVQHQTAYFAHLDRTCLQPMTLQACARSLGFATSTISRAVQEKYIQVQGKIVPLRPLFQQGVTAKITPLQIMHLISELIEHEDPAVPLTDTQLTARLNQAGQPLARRTVAKYRRKAGFATHYLRAKPRK